MLKQRIIPKLAWEALKDAALYHAEHKNFSDEILVQLHSLFGATFASAAELLENCKVTHYHNPDKSRSVYRVGPQSDSYALYNDVNFCKCVAFQTHVLEHQTEITCKHVLALQLNKITGATSVCSKIMTDSQLGDLLDDLLVLVNED